MSRSPYDLSGRNCAAAFSHHRGADPMPTDKMKTNATIRIDATEVAQLSAGLAGAIKLLEQWAVSARPDRPLRQETEAFLRAIAKELTR
jgi:hypothetical protein